MPDEAQAPEPSRQLDEAQVRAFVDDGFVHVEGAFPRETADACRDVLWRSTGADPRDPDGWPPAAVGIGERTEESFREAATASALRAAFDVLVGPGRWQVPDGLGGFVVRFPGGRPAVVDGWHVDVSFPGEDLEPGSTDYMRWRANVTSRDCALRMFFLFSDVGEDDAPTRMRRGSHRDVARLLEPAGEAGLDARELARRAGAASAHRPVVHATGRAGDVYLCHPFLVHAGQPHRGTRPRFLGQPKLVPSRPLCGDGGRSPVEAVIRQALAG
ncbi:phytanoyl-CoA dioxygenase family protein [Streptomyces sp. HNM0574]|uniref:phytanoyl-CoA dioxygenase family protein n=1 Tax=Streptomyces sp. HNM0574 TaxID=2714954 RepID=UPI00146A12FC|nr:phytanoyl-CoA dioxygenase family protein [Streptomyces sp. HNM0574]NLU68761.1 phytanoyl-CoA dioxygenase family protein [Streptomyces sp. HNM0574]